MALDGRVTKTIFDFSEENEEGIPIVGLRVLPGGPAFSFDEFRVENQFKRFIIIGAEPGCDLIIEDESISALHCMVERRNHLVLVHDCESKNGTRVNGSLVKVGEMVVGTLLTVGTTTMVAYGSDPDENRITITASSLQEYLANAVDAYGSVRSAAEAIGLPYSTLRGWLKNKYGGGERPDDTPGSE